MRPHALSTFCTTPYGHTLAVTLAKQGEKGPARPYLRLRGRCNHTGRRAVVVVLRRRHKAAQHVPGDFGGLLRRRFQAPGTRGAVRRIGQRAEQTHRAPQRRDSICRPRPAESRPPTLKVSDTDVDSFPALPFAAAAAIGSLGQTRGRRGPEQAQLPDKSMIAVCGAPPSRRLARPT